MVTDADGYQRRSRRAGVVVLPMEGEAPVIDPNAPIPF
jgi:hypothetical protein